MTIFSSSQFGTLAHWTEQKIMPEKPGRKYGHFSPAWMKTFVYLKQKKRKFEL
jgi:hypothetical protein